MEMAELNVINIVPSNPEIAKLLSTTEQGLFCLNTCQRTLMISMNPGTKLKLLKTDNCQLFSAKNAYQFLLETITGLQSKVQAESEVVAQFKTAYSEYLNLVGRNSSVIKILEKLFKDSKEIRSKYLLGVGQKTYAGITRKFISQTAASNEVLLLGTGKLAVDLIYVLKKRFKIVISGRNKDKVSMLTKEFNITAIPWKDYPEYSRFPQIVNSIGCDKILFDDHNFFNEWSKKNMTKIFVDLGEPSILQTKLDKNHGVYVLPDIFDAGAIQSQEKQKKIDLAQHAINQLTLRRVQLMQRTSFA